MNADGPERTRRRWCAAALALSIACSAIAQPGGAGGEPAGGGVEERVEARVAELEAAGGGERWVRSLVDRSRSRYQEGAFVASAAAARLAWRVSNDRVESGERERPAMEAAFNEGAALLSLGAFESARTRLRAVRAMEASDGFERRLAADAAYNLGLIALATADAEAESFRADADPLVGVLLGDAQEGWRSYDEAADRVIGLYTDAARLFEERLAADPSDEEAARNAQIARLRAGEVQRARYAAWEEREAIASRIVRPDEAIARLQRLADAQEAEAEETKDRRAEASVEPARLRREQRADQRPITSDSDALFSGVAATRELLGGRLGDSLPAPTREILATLYEEAELGLWDAVDGQRWAEYEFDEGGLEEAASLQAQAARDLRDILEKLRSRTPPPPQQQQQQRGDNESTGEAERSERDSSEETDPPDENTGDTDFEDERLAERRDRLLRQIFEREEIDLERVRRSKRRESEPVEQDW
jgi:hypothetical protein